MLVKNNSQKKFQKAGVLLSCVIAITMILSGCGLAPTPKIYRVGILSGFEFFYPAVDGFKAKMTELGYVEGENIVYDVQTAPVDIEAYRSIADKFVEDQVDLIFVFPTEASMEAKAATQGTNIPVIFDLAFTDVEGIDLIETIRQPGGNITGVRFPSAEIASKRLQILLELAPDAKQVFVAYFEGYPNVPGQLEAIDTLADSAGVTLVKFGTTSPDELKAELDRQAVSGELDAILLLAEPISATPAFFTLLGKYSYEQKIPIGGTLISMDGYSTIFGLLPQAYQTGEHAAVMADKIFTGTPAGTIPVITAESLFQIDYNAGLALGVTFPDGLLKQADEIIR
jgi:putative tryptophan/tyrosine transport system substrate-binding protein